MTLSMPDAVAVGNIPMGYRYILCYVDGDFPTAERVPGLFPGVKTLTLTVTGAMPSSLAADGCDCENGDLTAAGAAEWAAMKLATWPATARPVIYASRDNMPGVLAELPARKVSRPQVRLLSAHYEWKPGGAADHICGPATCGAGYQADGTQWTETFPGVGGTAIDMSTLADDFFGPPADWTFYPVRSLALLAAGPHSAKFSWDSPAGPSGAGAVDHYQLTVRHLGQDVAAPVDLRKGGNPEVYQWNDLIPGTDYELFVRAVAVNGHAGPWAAVTFRTG